MPSRAPSFTRSVVFIAVACFALAAACGRSGIDDFTNPDASADAAPFDATFDVVGDAQPDRDGGDGGARCNIGTCPTGCCDAAGVCQAGTGARACGDFANKCVDCTATGFDFCDAKSRTCGKITPMCGPGNCKGCCEGQVCLAGDGQNECGGGGQACQHCANEGLACDAAQCVKPACGPTNCKGCCFGNECLAGTDPGACGQLGQVCQNCLAQNETCTPQNVGGQCAMPTCNSTNCKGCCLGNQCVTGNDPKACGTGGTQCQDCAAINEVCTPTPGGLKCEPQIACGPQNCNGCCQGNTCVGGTDPKACGTKGQQCQDCSAPGETCMAIPPGGGVCSMASLCGPQNCTGCCLGDQCVTGTTDTECGAKGQRCADCTTRGDVCQMQTCVTPPPPCGPNNCTGCCINGICAVGSQDQACGTGGQACANCTTSNEICTNAMCVPKPPTCDATNCPGCCDATGTCEAGFLDNACGQNGAACADCTAMGSTCDTGVTPRACQSSCPEPYPGCDPSVTTTPPPTVPGACTASDLMNAAAACSGGATTAACQNYFSFEKQVRPQCASCLAPFDVDFNQFSGLFACVAPFVDANCDHVTGCAVDCEDQSCSLCDSSTKQTCEDTVRQGQCSTYFQQSQCVFPAFFGLGAFCNPNNYGGNFGQWLEGVGGHYCNP